MSVATLSGGFVGVDVFFVISGYLITGLLLKDQGRLSLMAFYERRVRRILPALVFMLAGTTVLCCILLLPDELRKYGLNLIETATFCLNIFVWRDTGYFGQEAIQRPLLHLWSLSVEEQFYLLWPATLIFIRRPGRPLHYLGPTTAIILLSLALSQWMAVNAPGAAFYLPISRAWEPMVGALIASPAVRPVTSRRLRETLAAAGLGLILVAACTFTGATPFPGLNAVLPCVGAALVIYSGIGSITLSGRFLGSPPLVGAGIISYSLYLWHWPLYALTCLWFGRDLSLPALLSVFGASVLLAYLSWRYVEVPFRSRTGPIASRRFAGLFAIAGLSSVLITGSAIAALDGFPARLSPRNAESFALEEQSSPLERNCHISAGDPLPPAQTCVFGKPAAMGTYDAILWGDSHANVLEPAIAQLALRYGLTFRQMTMSSCNPASDGRPVDIPANAAIACKALDDAVLRIVETSGKIRLVVASARWSGYRENGPNGFLSRKLATIAKRIIARNARFILIGSVPEPPFSPARRVARREMLGADLTAPLTFHEPPGNRDADIALANAIHGLSGAGVFFPMHVMCLEPVCSAGRDDAVYYRDDNHLSIAGALHLAPYLIKAVGAAASK